MGRATSLLVWVVLFGLVADANSAAAQDKASSPFAGRFSGTFTFKSTDPSFPTQQGKAAVLIDAKGKLKMNISTVNNQGSAEGTVSEDGDTIYTVDFGDQAYVVKGTLAKTTQGHLKGTLNQYFGKDRILGVITFDFPPSE